MIKIKKAIIPAAGLGTRFLPATKAQPKEMLPIIDKPLIQYIVEEAVSAGIEDIIIVTGPSKRAIEDHFDHSVELENLLIKSGKKDKAEEIKKIAELANFIYIRQKGPYGNGTPVLNAKHLIGDEPFAVMFGDDLFVGKTSRLKQLMSVFQKYTDPVLTVIPTDNEGTKKYGIIDGVKIEKNVYQLKTIIEKPGPEKAPSRLASISGYIFTPDIFDALEKTPLGKGGELWLVDAIFRLSKTRPIYACQVDAKYYDVGSPAGWLKANFELSKIKK